jgi:hypothetical protein
MAEVRPSAGYDDNYRYERRSYEVPPPPPPPYPDYEYRRYERYDEPYRR